MRIGRLEFDPSQRTLVMGILNVTPDSFSDGGAFFEPEQALERALQMEAEGAELIDVGGESTRPGSEAVPEGEERERVLPVLRRILPHLKIPVSLDTQKSAIARLGLEEGASMINDISALEDASMAGVIARSGASVILLHKKGRPKTMQEQVHYDDLLAEVSQFLKGRASRAEQAGIERDRIFLDPGIGFGKGVEHNLEIIRRLEHLQELGFPLVVGASRKSFLGKILSREPLDRREGGLAVAAVAAWKGAAIIRTHDVRATHDVVRVVEALKRC